MKTLRRGPKPKHGTTMVKKLSVRLTEGEHHALRARAQNNSVAELVRQRVADLLAIP